jgi:hypothetical protein
MVAANQRDANAAWGASGGWAFRVGDRSHQKKR